MLAPTERAARRCQITQQEHDPIASPSQPTRTHRDLPPALVPRRRRRVFHARLHHHGVEALASGAPVLGGGSGGRTRMRDGAAEVGHGTAIPVDRGALPARRVDTFLAGIQGLQFPVHPELLVSNPLVDAVVVQPHARADEVAAASEFAFERPPQNPPAPDEHLAREHRKHR